ncbi:MAG TPA: GFA family protein [Stellaceae bacterium]|jgi:hypothetical protein|nr:GFA family protein [Stellaceae bacterium]
MIQASCHCGAIELEIDLAPEEITDCNCSICRRYGALWAYYSPAQVHIVQPASTDIYTWDDKSIQFHRCRNCGCVTHWSAVAASTDRMGVNARLMAPDVVKRARLRFLDGAVTERYLDE